jgi:hypothetical protein
MPMRGNGDTIVRPGGQKVILVELCDERSFTTLGGGAYANSIVGPVLKDMGPFIEDIVVHANGRNFSTNFKYKILGQYSYDGETWTNFASDVLSEQTTTGTKISSAYSTRTDLGLRIRFKIGVNDTAAAKETGTLSVTVAIKVAT